jgi:signal transduction histidine kinase
VKEMAQDTTYQDQELAALLEVARSLSSTLELGPLLRLILDQLKLVADYSGAGVWIVDGDHLRLLEARGATAADRELEAIGLSFTRAEAGPIWERLSRREPVIIDNVRGEGELAAVYRKAVGPLLESPEIRYVRSFLAVPLVYREEVIGYLSLSKSEPGYYTHRHARTAAAIAAHAATAIAHARLYEHERAAQSALARQIDRLTTLTDITRRLLAATDLDDVMGIVVESAIRLCDAAGAMVELIDEERKHLAALAWHGEPRAFYMWFSASVLTDEFMAETAAGQALAYRQAVAVEDYESWPTGYANKQRALDLGVRAVAVAPLLVDGEPIGVLWVSDVEPRPFSPEDMAVVQALADQAALAIEHARLVQRGRDAAIIEERARLARDLHDSVTQSVFSLGMLARAAKTQHERDSDRLGSTLDRIGVLAQEALVEMRTLLLELQPSTLAEQGLAKALERLVASVRVRSDLTASFSATTRERLPADTELAVYRIVQEAIANAVKHAHATSLTVALHEDGGSLVATITDNGVGFDTAAVTAATEDIARGGLGLRSMRERADAAGLVVHITSALNAGTTVTVRAPLSERL